MSLICRSPLSLACLPVQHMWPDVEVADKPPRLLRMATWTALPVGAHRAVQRWMKPFQTAFCLSLMIKSYFKRSLRVYSILFKRLSMSLCLFWSLRTLSLQLGPVAVGMTAVQSSKRHSWPFRDLRGATWRPWKAWRWKPCLWPRPADIALRSCWHIVERGERVWFSTETSFGDT